ncbi:DeoR/GlpR family DNA-binding transcription regulator [Nocardioides mangrovi]|uniref:DeoR/GlpR family DNA-binding transcription regulator n=1 Tax=Nocardioides mangrovi TaxID=2874580 RepID=A0ABS7UCM5_9ACTN|nr:DeoR/GlpR family DNA-binding transcription regulator [Nocardioides mangrovi]MBZ5738736.1 DeoR/GlpR family DNA-binding transcription regulator [Nocardioides mangrovi]
MPRASSNPRPWRRAERVATILDHLDAVGSISVPELADMFGVSLATVRRDLQLLEEQKLLERTHGGAVAVDVAHELPVRYRSGNTAQKRDIARVAVSRVPMGAVVGLNGGSTTLEVARQLAVRESLSVVTNALNIAAELALKPKFKVVVPGGVARPQSYELVGLWSDQALRVLNVGVAIVGVDGVDCVGGITTHDEVEAQTNAALLSRARRVIVVADSSKFGRVQLARIAGIAEVDEIITDAQADPTEVERLRAAGATVTIAPPARGASRGLTAVRTDDEERGELA